MGTKLILLICAVFFTSCVDNRTMENEPYTKKEYVLAYKKMVLYGCLNEKTNGEFRNLMRIHNNVNSKEVAILFASIANEADSLGIKYSRSINPYDHYGDLKGKVPIFGNCVDYAFSKEVDSIANRSYLNSRPK